jgi:hypothetical protein
MSGFISIPLSVFSSVLRGGLQLPAAVHAGTNDMHHHRLIQRGVAQVLIKLLDDWLRPRMGLKNTGSKCIRGIVASLVRKSRSARRQRGP